MTRLILSVAFGFVSYASLGMAAPFTNGDFELPGTAGSIFLPSGSTFVTGWIHGGNDNGEFYTQSGAWGFNAFDGSHYMGWGANGATNGTLAQTFDTVIGTTYNINYMLTTQQLPGVPPLEVVLVEALNGGSLLNSVTNSFQPLAGVWISGTTLSFVAASTSTTLRFTDLTTPSNSGPVNWGLDGITVNGVVGGVVPEPATFTLIGLGLGALALGRRVGRK